MARIKSGVLSGRYELWPRFQGVLMTVKTVASSSGSTCDGTDKASSSRSTCDGTSNAPLNGSG